MSTIENQHKPQHDRENPARRLDRRSWWALGLVAGLIVFHQFLLQPALTRLTSDAPAINIAGRQRMLSQKLAKAALAMLGTNDPSEADLRKQELQSTLGEWRNAHRTLQAGNARIHGPGTPPDAIQLGFQELDGHFQAMAHAADQLLGEPSPELSRQALATLLQHEPEFLNKMHALVGAYEADARLHVHQLQSLGLTIMVVILLTQVAVQMGIVRPAVQIVGEEIAQTEAQYQKLVESMTDGLVVFDAQGRMEFANRSFGLMMGYRPGELPRQPASALIAPADLDRFQGLLSGKVTSTDPLDLLLQRASGQMVETMVSPQRLFDHHGTSQGLLLVVTDVTARKAVEQRSRELLDELAHADRLKSMGTMAAALAHEINQPLGAIANYAEGCLTRISGQFMEASDLEVPLQRILRATHRGAEIIRRSQDFVRHRHYHREEESINDLVHEVEELCRPEARRRGIALELRLATELPPIAVDGIQIQQVLTNLIQNAFAALDHSSSPRKIVKVHTELSNGSLELSVSDTGPGIPRVGVESWFEPFMTTRKNGTGMGLAISRSIVESHGGQLWAEAGRDGGAVFRFTLPLGHPSEQGGHFEQSDEAVMCYG